ncbi:MAG: sulfatase-like hydrolase/transferase [Eubacteriales bacterium]
MSEFQPKKPNILFILSDQHNASFLGCNGNELINTPHLDMLASQGVLFENAYCQNPLCVPSRCSLLTGKYSKNLGIYENRHILESDSTTIPKVLLEQGYKTCVIGKTHFNGEQYQGYQQRPYGDLFGQAHQPDPKRTEPAPDSGLGDVIGNSGATGIPLPLTQTEICVSETAKWLQTHAAQKDSRPFMLSVNFDKPHFPIRAPKKYFEKYKGKVRIPEFYPDYIEKYAVPFVKKAFEVNGAWEHYGKDRDIHERALAAYYACIEWVDNAIGRILQVLEYLELADDTIIIYASDHGEMAGEKGAWQKTVFFDASSKVPFIMRWPSKFPAGQRRKEPVGLIDLFPTLCDFAGIPAPKECDGISLKPLLFGDETIERKAIFCESVVLKVPEYAGCMIRNEKWKYSYYLDGTEELYDMKNDPGELNNLASVEQYSLLSKK